MAGPELFVITEFDCTLRISKFCNINQTQVKQQQKKFVRGLEYGYAFDSWGSCVQSCLALKRELCHHFLQR